MTDIADNVIATLNAVQALTAQVTALTTAVAAIAVPAVDLSGINTKLDTLLGDLEPTATPAASSDPVAETSDTTATA